MREQSRSIYRRKTTGISAYILFVIAAIVLLLFGALHVPRYGYELKNGKLDLTGYQRPDDRVIYLDGEWEYYPGILIASEPSDKQMEAVLTELPVRGLSRNAVRPESGKASYRIELVNVPEEVVLALTLPAYYGEYRVYLDGKLQVTPISQESAGYFPFTFIRDYSGTTHELIIELEQSVFFGFDKYPVLSDNDIPFNNYSGIRIVFFVFMGMMLFAYVILPGLYRCYRDSYLCCFALTGLITLLLFVVETIWYCGILGYIQLVLRADILYVIRNLLKILLSVVILWASVYQRKPLVEQRMRKCLAVLGGVLVAAAVLAQFALSRPVAMSILCCCNGVMAAISVVVLGRGVWRSGKAALIPGIGSVAILTGFFFVDLSAGATATLWQQMVLPACMLITLLCWSLMIADRERVQIETLEKALAAEQVAARTQAAFLASQIQPHFLYNTLTTIQELCYTEPIRAAETVIRFSNYLRQNIDFMEYKDKIPFAVELEHIDNYVEIQQTRFGAAIRFVKNISFDQFELPPLTVQPLVENAVSHGIRRAAGRGTVTVEAKKIGHDIVITVADDGQGFDVEAVHSRSLENIRCRIEGGMHGIVQINSRPGAGTSVMIQFPYKEGMIHENHDR